MKHMSDKQDIRKTFKDEVIKRDGCKCLGCDFVFKKAHAEEFLDAHHIIDRNEMPNGGYVKENGISLCKAKCHLKAEKFHMTGGLEWEEGFHPDDLFKKINSSKELATAKSEEL